MRWRYDCGLVGSVTYGVTVNRSPPSLDSWNTIATQRTCVSRNMVFTTACTS